MDVRKIGAFISERRKNKDYTQAELAMLLSVSHQAVSKWERGESLPDIGMLPGLAKLLETTVDELLNGEQTSYEEDHSNAISSSEPTESFTSPIPSSDESPDTSSKSNGNSSERQRLTWDHVIGLAPFLGQDILESMIDQIEGDLNWSALSALAPFVGRSAIERMADKMTEGHVNIRQITGIAPFLGKDLLERMLTYTEEGSIDWDALLALAPFIERSTLSQLARQVTVDAPDPWRIVGLAPFLEPTALMQVIERIEPGTLSPEVLPGLAPFLPQEQLNKLVLQF